MKSEYQISITTYEGDKLTLAHIFYGDSLKDAINIAKSHIITDEFFRSSFLGSMEWKGNTLKLSNNYEVFEHKGDINAKEIMKILEKRAIEVENENKMK